MSNEYEIAKELVQREDIAVTEFEYKPEDRKIRGYAIKFGVASDNPLWGDMYEVISSRSVAKTLQDRANVRALVGHDSDKVLGTVQAGTLHLKSDEIGLYFEIDVPEGEKRTYEKDLLISLERGEVLGCSFGFIPLQAHEEYRNDLEKTVVVIDEMKLREISIVTFPAYSATEVAFRSDDPEGFVEALTDEQKIALREVFEAETERSEEPSDSTDTPEEAADLEPSESEDSTPPEETGEPEVRDEDTQTELRSKWLDEINKLRGC